MFRSRRDFAYDTRRNDEVLIVSPRGHLDTQATNSFEMEMRRVLDEGARRVVFDLASLDFISSSGVRIVLVTARVLQRHQGRFALWQPQAAHHGYLPSGGNGPYRAHHRIAGDRGRVGSRYGVAMYPRRARTLSRESRISTSISCQRPSAWPGAG